MKNTPKAIKLALAGFALLASAAQPLSANCHVEAQVVEFFKPILCGNIVAFNQNYGKLSFRAFCERLICILQQSSDAKFQSCISVLEQIKNTRDQNVIKDALGQFMPIFKEIFERIAGKPTAGEFDIKIRFGLILKNK